MSRSYWLPVIAAIGWIALAGWAESHGGGQGAYQQYVQAKETNQSDPQRITPPSIQPVQSGDIASPCVDPKTKDDRDLCQQWRMAEAAEQMIKVSWTQLALTGASLLGLILTVYYSRVAASAAIKTVDAIHTIERAYVFVSVKKIRINHNSNGDLQIYFKIVVRNAGKTPAILTKHRALMVMLRDYPDTLSMAPDTDIMPPGKIISAGKASIAEDKFAFSSENGESIAAGHYKLLCLGEVHYRTIDGKDRITGFCWDYKPGDSRFDISPTKKLNYQT